MAGKAIKQRTKATRYRTEDDPDDGSMALMAAAVGPPAMCAVFILPDEDEADPEYTKKAALQLARTIGKLLALNLNVDEYKNKAGTYMYLKISAPDTLLRYEAEENIYQLRLLKEEYGGALCAYSAELEERDAFEKPLAQDHALFCSAFQLKMIREVVNSEAYGADDGEGAEDAIDFGQLMEEDSQGPGMKIVEAYFPLHHERIRMKLLMEWARATSKPQPLEIMREYFGEKMALFYTWLGFYCTMLWIPGLTGAALFVTQVITFVETGSLENPYCLVYACVLSLWANVFCALWKQLENTRKYQWDMLAFEDFEEIRDEFKESAKTVKDKGDDEDGPDPHINEVTGDVDGYWYDDGTYLPLPTGRARDQLLTYSVVLLIIVIVVVCFDYIWVNVTHPLMEPGNVIIGGILGGVLNSIITIAIDCVMDGVAELELEGVTGWLVGEENWETDTKYEDAIIMKTFYFKFFSKYFALLMVSFGVNHVELSGDVHKCPDFQCLPVAQCMFVTIIVIDIAYQQIVQHVFPMINKFFDSLRAPAGAVESNGQKSQLTPQEEQYEWLVATPVVDLYKDKIYQFGYIVMFGLIFPLVVPICLVVNLLELRSRALTLLTKNRRPDPLQAADIGSYQPVLEVLATLSILTNSALIGITSYGLYFYFPEMTIVESLWATVVLEHVLFVLKCFIANILPEEVADAKLVWQTAENIKGEFLEKWGIVEKELEDPTPF